MTLGRAVRCTTHACLGLWQLSRGGRNGRAEHPTSLILPSGRQSRQLLMHVTRGQSPQSKVRWPSPAPRGLGHGHPHWAARGCPRRGLVITLMWPECPPPVQVTQGRRDRGSSPPPCGTLGPSAAPHSCPRNTQEQVQGLGGAPSAVKGASRNVFSERHVAGTSPDRGHGVEDGVTQWERPGASVQGFCTGL